MGDLDVTKTISLEQCVSVARQGEVSIPAEGDGLIRPRIRVKIRTKIRVKVRKWSRAGKRASLCLIFCIVFSFWISLERATAAGPERAKADGSKSGAALVEVRFTNGREFTEGLRNGWAQDLPLPNGMAAGGGNGILESAGVALFVSGLSRYLPQNSPQRRGQAEEYAGQREFDEYQLAGKQRQIALRLELLLAGLLLCGLAYWGGAAWVDRC